MCPSADAEGQQLLERLHNESAESIDEAEQHKLKQDQHRKASRARLAVILAVMCYACKRPMDEIFLAI